VKASILLSLAGLCAAAAIGFYMYDQSGSSTSPSLPVTTPPAPSIRVARVDMRRLFDSHPQTKTSEAAVNAMRAEARSEYQRLKEGGDETAATRFKDKRTKEIEAEAARLRNKIVKELQALLNRVAASKNLDLLFDSSGNSTLGAPVVLHAACVTDITEEILQEINR
jgi:Skp family chaperone for outer membrane proteins